MRHALVAIALVATACGNAPARPAPKETVFWQELGSWSGRGNVQTETFVGLTGSLRFHWKTTSSDPKSPGTFRLILGSGVSGRDLLTAVDAQGPGEGTAYAVEDPRLFYIVVESSDLDWAFSVEEAAFVTERTD
jgi:hypothetical protein